MITSAVTDEASFTPKPALPQPDLASLVLARPGNGELV